MLLNLETKAMKSFRLIGHQETFSDDDLVINQKDYPEACKNDIVEIYHPNQQEDEGRNNDTQEEYPHLLLQITSFREDMVQQRTISVKQSIAQAFGLKIYKDVIVQLVKAEEVALESVELTFKDQYMGRSEMWRLKNSLVNSCVYINKKLEFCGGSVRCQVYEMWSSGERVACGVITEDTKVVFRSSTAMVYIFLQMSSEMWDFDIYGDLYFEKAVNGFLSDLFMKWKKNGSNHEVTIVLFSRTFYEATSLEEFPEHMRECLQRDYLGRYYEDFYRVPIQNEKYDDWSPILVQLRRIFQEYLNIVLKYHARSNMTIPAASNSTAAQGNFLEVLNMSLNVFEKHYLDRSFDRTGQLSVVITPGVGVFEVDWELTNITKQRIIDGGVGSDLVCVGEQPLHAVPLLKFNNKDSNFDLSNDYSMPHWINLSFYSTNKKMPYSNFIPRIKLPPPIPDNVPYKFKEPDKEELLSEDDPSRESITDYDAYDAAVFQIPTRHQVPDSSATMPKMSSRNKKSSGCLLDSQEQLSKGGRRKMSDPDLLQHKNDARRSDPIAIPSTTTYPLIASGFEQKEYLPNARKVVGSEGSPPREFRALVNPFDPSHVTIKLTSNRRRWTHIFPKGPTGVLIQQHHYQAVPAQPVNRGDQVPQQNNTSLVITAALQEYCKKRPNQTSGLSNSSLNARHSRKSFTFLWGATGEQEWTPALTTGVDWKSLTIPACLPITTDYFPDRYSITNHYFESHYSLVPDSVYADFAQPRGTYKRPLTTEEVCRELVSQRLAQGFQLILLNNNQNNSSTKANQNNEKSSESESNDHHHQELQHPQQELSHVKNNPLLASANANEEAYFLSIGRLFHKIVLAGNTICVNRFRPRYPYPGFNYQYRYRFHAPYHDNYEESFATFTTEKLEHFNWNYLDHYVCTGGNTTDFSLVEALKFWRFRVYLLPLNSAETKKIVDGATRCDIYSLPTPAAHNQMIEGFLKFIEIAVNKLKKTNSTSKKPRMSLSVQTLPPLAQPRRNSISSFTQNINSSSPFRERLGSNRLSDRPRPRSGSKVLERSRMSQGSQDQPPENMDSSAADDGLSMNVTPLNLTSNCEIIDAMKNQCSGLCFINTSHNMLPTNTFVAADAVNWLISHMVGVSSVGKAVQIMERLNAAKLIRHASGDSNKQFLYGFYLFYIVANGKCDKANADVNAKLDTCQNEKEEKELAPPPGSIESFENEFVEVEIKRPLNWGHSNMNGCDQCAVPHFLYDKIDSEYVDADPSDIMYNKVRLDTDVAGKSDRTEWGHCRYQTVFRPDQAYELVVEWLTSSGSIVGELLLGWHRKGTACGLQMIPVPHDPLALPYSNKSDPLRGPIFIPLNVKCLETKDHLFKDFGKETWLERMFLFQEAIIQRFGFIKCLVESPSSDNKKQSREHQYIHATGTIFVMISRPGPPKQENSLNEQKKLANQQKFSLHADDASSMHQAYITRHVSGKNKADYDNCRKMGYLWCWNHMISRRWRTNQGVDNNFQIKCLKDFKSFCANSENRLKTFWEKSLDTKHSCK